MSTPSTPPTPSSSLERKEEDALDTLDTRQTPIEEKSLSDSRKGGEQDVVELPDGGLRAWLVVFGAMCNHFCSLGYISAWGTFQAYYQGTILRTSTPADIAWVGSIQVGLSLMPGLVVGRLLDMGYCRPSLAVSSALIIIGTFLVPECKSYWQFLLCQGFTIGLGTGGVIAINLSIVGHWFKRRRGLAVSVVATGASIGGVSFPIIIRALLLRVGFPWCMRIVGFLLMLLLGVGNVLLRTRLPPSTVGFQRKAFRQLFSSPAYVVYCASGFTAFMGAWTALTFLNAFALSIGISPGFAIYLTSIANGVSIISRPLCGHASDRWGPLNVMIPSTLILGISTYAWPYAKDQASLIAIAVIYGFVSWPPILRFIPTDTFSDPSFALGAYFALITNPVYPMGPSGDLGLRIGVALTVFGFGALIGTPISGTIQRSTGSYAPVGLYAGEYTAFGRPLVYDFDSSTLGSTNVVAAIQMILARQLLLGWTVLKGKV
ncbi:hypothetical protein V5O48_012474 [Marasmius crinis-equi]|uniref:Uncharacterized protein n=1 Tax=Marasmius crinis-equi TaxID=585013 RepID=A0ABR3F309_9AGAR